jgi:hypothetical protein
VEEKVMAISVGGTVTITIRDLEQIPADPAAARAFVLGDLAEAVLAKISAAKELVASGVAQVAQRNAVVAVEARDISVGISISGSF